MKQFIFVFGIVVGLAVANCHAGLVITISESSSNSVEVAWSGSGTIGSRTGVGEILDLLNFGDIFAFSGTRSFTSGVDALVLSNTTDPTNTETLDVSEIELINSNTRNQDDIDFTLSNSISNVFNNSDRYVASGSVTLSGISINQFTAGNFEAGAVGSSGDSGVFGASGVSGSFDNFAGVRLRITGVPEPTSLTLFGLAVGAMFLGPRRRRIS
jgi:hypothetical protein